MSRIELAFLSQPVELVAPQLLGCLLIRDINGQKLIGKIVETEAYDETDAASHSYRGRTPRTDIMFGPAGYLYVYFTYGMHYCCNIVTGKEGEGSAVLIRALEPIMGQYQMRANRRNAESLSNGPAKLCQALAIDKTMNKHDLTKPPFKLIVKPPIPQELIIQTTRIGITRAKDTPRRFYVGNNPFVSKPAAVLG